MVTHTDYYLGLDLGQTQDPSALTVVERSPLGETAEWRHAVRHLHRWQLGTPYPQVVADVAELTRRPELADCTLVIDGTGVGRAVVDLFRAADLPALLCGVLITAGHVTTYADDGTWHVPKKELVSVVQVLLQTRRLHIANVPERTVLAQELGAFRVKVNAATGHESFEAWRERDHDDLVLAVALACWKAERDPGPQADGEPMVLGEGYDRNRLGGGGRRWRL